MSTKKKKMTTTALAVALAVLLLIGGGTFAYLQSTTNDVTNNFKANKVMVDLTESGDGQYHIIPGTTEEKDPTVKVNATVDAYVFVEVTDTTQGLVGYEIADGWTKLDGYDNVYYREVSGSDVEQSFSVLKDNQVTYDAALENSDMLENGQLKTGIQLTFKAHAIQKEGFRNAEEAYKQIPVQIGSDIELKTAIESGKSVLLSKDIAISKNQNNYTEYNLAENTTLDLNGKTLTVPFLKGIFQGENVTLKNGTVESEASYPLFIGNGTQVTSVMVENVNLNGGINVFEGSVVLKNVTADASSKEYYAVWADHGATVTIESGTFIGGNNNVAVLAAAESGEGSAGSIIIKGGKFNTDISTYVASGYHVEKDGQWYRVKKNN